MPATDRDPIARLRADKSPEPSFAERSRTLIHIGRIGVLSTLSRRHPGLPFGSLAPYGLDDRGRPTFLFSAMAMHTQNLASDPNASLLVTQPGWDDDPLAGGRLTLLGQVGPVPEAERQAIRKVYLERQPNATQWADFQDFAFYRLEVAELYYVAGFGAMSWVAADEYAKASPDPLADSAAAILAHMNSDHSDALLLYCRAFAGFDADAAQMVGVDRLGFRIRARSGTTSGVLRLGFAHPVRDAAEARAALVKMVREARARITTPASRKTEKPG